MIIIILTFAFVGTFLAIWGTQTRGSWSQNIGITGGLIWLVSLVWAIVELGLKTGLLVLLGTFVLGGILISVLSKKT